MRPQRGFTLLEIILVMALVAIAFALVGTAISQANPGVQLREHALRMANGLRHARASALRTQRPQRFVLDVREHHWKSVGQPVQEMPQAIELRVTGGAELSMREGEGAIVFFPDGASSGGRIILQRGGRQWRIDVNWITSEIVLRQESSS